MSDVVIYFHLKISYHFYNALLQAITVDNTVYQGCDLQYFNFILNSFVVGIYGDKSKQGITLNYCIQFFRKTKAS